MICSLHNCCQAFSLQSPLRRVLIKSVRCASSSSVSVNGRVYRVPSPTTPVVAILIDGCAQEYLDKASAAGCMPNYNRILGRTIQPQPQSQSLSRSHSSRDSSRKYNPYFITSPSECSGEAAQVSGVMPSFTNTNNMSVITGTTPSVHGIAGNYYYSQQQDKEMMMTDPQLITCDTILETMNQQAGVNITIITVKDKLARLLSKGLNKDTSTTISIEALSQTTHRGHIDIRDTFNKLISQGVSVPKEIPSIYDPQCSITALQMGLTLIQHDMQKDPTHTKPHIYYLTTTDYVQHTYPPGHSIANIFYQQIDNILGSLHQLPVHYGFTADHGMNDKYREADHSPRVVYIEDVLTQGGFKSNQIRVILPITDPHVIHHGALGGYATVYVSDPNLLTSLMDLLRQQRGVYSVLGRQEASTALELPADRIGDVVVLADRHSVLGKSAAYHAASLSQIRGLRSHGGLDELQVPLFVGHRVVNKEMKKRMARGKLRNFDLFDVLLNGACS